jgi:NADPH:quinone reductase-like Zn-dependent oxidoreductase
VYMAGIVVAAVGFFCGLPAVLYIFSYLTSPLFVYRGAHVLVTGGSSGIGLELAKGQFLF